MTLEGFLARLYTDAALRAAFRADPGGEAARAGLAAEEVESLARADLTGIELVAQTLRHKRAAKAARARG